MNEVDFKARENKLNVRKSKVVIDGLESAKDLAEIIKYLMVDRKSTYSLSKNGNRRHQCAAYRARTIEDCYLVAKSYGIEASYEDIHKAVQKLYGEHLMHSYCYTVKRQVHTPKNMNIRVETLRTTLGKFNFKPKPDVRQVEEVGQLLNKLDPYYEMSDSSSVYETGQRNLEDIKRRVGNLTPHEKTKYQNTSIILEK